MSSIQRPMDRSLELACDRALSGLSPTEEAELGALVARGARIDPGLEIAAAAIALAEMSLEEPLPFHVLQKVQAAAFRAGRSSEPPVDVRAARGGTVPIRIMKLDTPVANAPSDSKRVVPITSAPRKSRGWVPWLAAAACLGFAVGSLIYRAGTPPTELARRWGADSPLLTWSPPPPKPLGAAEQRERLLAEAPDAVRVAWSATKDPAGQGESGEVVWSNTRQQGFMTFKNLATNDPTKNQYQLWIFDGARDERYPVDGGVFDVDASKGEVVVPISAKVRVSDPKLFAITVEQPGGVVVSKRERIALAAKVQT